MKKMTCEKGHFYDGDVYGSCPICQKVKNDIGGPAAATAKRPGSDKEGSSKKKWLEKLIRPEKHTQEMPAEEESVTDENPGQNIVVRRDEKSKEPPVSNAMQEANELRGHTVRLQDVSDEKTASLAQQVASARQESASAGKTVAFYGGTGDPVTGWLVCVKGQAKGTSYNLKTGQNFIGRALNMDVALDKEQSVSRNRHAVIVFEPKKKIFFIQQGESSGLTYLNGELVMGMKQLSAYDRIQLGECELVFVPFCSDKFTWEKEGNSDEH